MTDPIFLSPPPPKFYTLFCFKDEYISSSHVQFVPMKLLSVRTIPKVYPILTFSLLLTTQEAFVDSVDQDQTAQNVQSDL